MVHELAQTLPVLKDAPTPPASRHQAHGNASVAGQLDMATGPDISQLTRAIVAGDEAAFTQFYDLYSARLGRFLLVLTAAQEDIARELHQVVMIKVARKFRVFTSHEQLWAWLAQVARNAFIDYVRKQNRRSEQPLSGPAPDSSQTPDEQSEEHLMKWLDQALQGLDGEDRALVKAVYFEERAHGHVAAETGQTTKAVESRLARIRARLRKFILTQLKHERKAI